MNLKFKSYKPGKSGFNKVVLVLNNYHKKSDTLRVINLPSSIVHTPSISKSLDNHIGHWRVKKDKRNELAPKAC